MNYVMSDLHGCYDKYKRMLEAISFRSTDTLYVLGDVIDRGPGGVKILLDMMGRPNVLPILGNHEFTAAVCLPWLLEEITEESLAALDESRIAALGEWTASGGNTTLRALRELDMETRQDILEYFQEMELFFEVEAGGRSFVLVHSGLDRFSPEKPLEDYELTDCLFCRPDPEAVYFPDRLLVFGHTPAAALGGGNRILRRETWIDIDCGCSFKGGQLGCLCLDTMEEFYV